MNYKWSIIAVALIVAVFITTSPTKVPPTMMNLVRTSTFYFPSNTTTSTTPIKPQSGTMDQGNKDIVAPTEHTSNTVPSSSPSLEATKLTNATPPPLPSTTKGSGCGAPPGTLSASDNIQLVCSGKGGVRHPMGIELTTWDGEATSTDPSSSTGGRNGHCYTQTKKGRDVIPIGYIAPRLCLDYNWLHGKSICDLRNDAKQSRRRSALFFAAAGGTSNKRHIATSTNGTASTVVDDHSFSVRIRSEYQKSKNFRIPATTSIPLTGTRITSTCDPTATPFHVVYFEDEHYALNLAHVMYRLIGITRTGLLLHELLTEAFKKSKREGKSSFEIKFINVLEMAGRSSGPFMMPFIDTLSPQLFTTYQVLPEDGTQVHRVSQQQQQPQRADVGMAIQLNCELQAAVDRQWDRNQYSFKQTLPGGEVHTSLGVQCLDNVVIEHVRPIFHVTFDSRSTAAAQYLRNSIVKAWMPVNPPTNTPTYITIINRLNSRIIVDGTGLVSSLNSYLKKRLCPSNPQCNTVPVVRLVSLEAIPKLSDQAALFHESSIVVAVHGAALAWAMAMKEMATIVEIVPPGFDRKVGPVSETFKGLFDALNLNHIPLKMRNQATFNPKKSKDFLMQGRDLDELCHIVGGALQSYRKGGGGIVNV